MVIGAIGGQKSRRRDAPHGSRPGLRPAARRVPGAVADAGAEGTAGATLARTARCGSSTMCDCCGARTSCALVISDLFVNLGVATSSSLFLFFWHAARGYSGPETSFIIFSTTLLHWFSVPLWLRVVRRIGKRSAFNVFGHGVRALHAPDGLPCRGIGSRWWFGHVPSGADLFRHDFPIRAMAADAGDESRLETGVDRMGQSNGLLASTAKIGSALAVGVAFAIMDKPDSSRSWARPTPPACCGS